MKVLLAVAVLLVGCDAPTFDREPELVSWQWDIWCMRDGTTAPLCDARRERRMQDRLELVKLWWDAGEIDLKCYPGEDGYYCGDGVAVIFHKLTRVE